MYSYINFNLRLFPSFVCVIRLITTSKYGFFCIYKVRSYHLAVLTLIHLIKIAHVLLKIIMIDSKEPVYYHEYGEIFLTYVLERKQSRNGL